MMVLIRRPFLRLAMAVIWMMLSDDYSLGSLIIGFVLATVILAVFPAPVVQFAEVRWTGPAHFVRWVISVLHLTVYFAWQVVVANYQVTRFALSPKLNLKPGIIGLRLRAQSDAQIALLATLITLTPGTVSIDVDDPKDMLFVHTIDAADADEAMRVPKRFEEMIMEVIP